MSEQFKYWAFISYSHQDKSWGDWLHKALETYRVPKRLVGRASRDGAVPKRLFPIFRDREELPTSADLGENINQALTQSPYLIVICSPKSAVSRWVNEEVKAFKAMGREDRILCLIVDGEPNASDKPNSGLLECFPEAVRYRVDSNRHITAERTEPIAADAREGKDGKVNVKLKLLAGLLGVSFDELRQRDKQRQFWRRVQLAATAATLICATASGWFWLDRQARVEKYAEQGRQQFVSGNPRRALVYLVEVYRNRSSNSGVRFLVAQAMRSIDAEAFALRHEGSVWSARFSADGKRILTASSDTTAKLWDGPTGELLVSFRGHTGDVASAEFSHNGLQVLTTSRDGTAKIWDAASGKALVTLSGHKSRVTAAAFSTDGGRIITGGWDKTAKLWDAATGTVLMLLSPHWTHVSSVAMSPDGKRIAVASYGSTSRIWDAASGKVIAQLEGHESQVKSIEFVADGRRIFSWGDDGTAKISDSESGRLILSFEGHTHPLFSAAFSPDKRRLLTSSSDKTAKLWDVATGKLVASLVGHKDTVTSAQFSPLGSLIATTSYDGTVKLWNAITLELLGTLDAHASSVFQIAFSQDGKRLLTASADRTAKVWDIAAAKAEIPMSETAGVFPKFSPNGRSILDGTAIHADEDRKTARVWDVASGRVIANLGGHESAVRSADFSPNGARIITVDQKVARIWDAGSYRLLSQISAPGAAVISGDGSRVATPGDPIRTVYTSEEISGKLWDATSGKLLFSMEHSGRVHSVEFSSNGALLATAGGDDKQAKIWNAATGALLFALTHAGSVNTASFSPDGRLVITASDDRTAKIWDAGTGTLLATLAGHTRGVQQAMFSPNGKRVLTMDALEEVVLWDPDRASQLTVFGRTSGITFSPDSARILAIARKSVRLWSAATGELLLSIDDDEEIFRASFSPDGEFIVTQDRAGAVKVWEATSGKLLTSLNFANASNGLAFSPDGSRILVRSGKGHLRLWNVGLENRSPAEIASRVKCHVPWKLEDGKLVPATPDPAACPKPASVR